MKISDNGFMSLFYLSRWVTVALDEFVNAGQVRNGSLLAGFWFIAWFTRKRYEICPYYWLGVLCSAPSDE